jgi:hypothetical protein
VFKNRKAEKQLRASKRDLNIEINRERRLKKNIYINACPKNDLGDDPVAFPYGKVPVRH